VDERTTPGVADANAAGDARALATRTQATSILKNIAGQLEKQGLTVKDVVYLRAYLVPDPTKGNRIDMEGWSAAR
jgi:enamine deaminase RidA (YjgF/YER057c/UK114 family)